MNVNKRKLFDDGVDRLLERAESIIPNEILPDLPYMELAPDVHAWHNFEHELWEIGEEIRQFVSVYSKTFNKNQIDRIISICLDKRAKRGRQSFVMLLGRKVYGEHANEIIAVLNDTDIEGHVIDTIYKMQAGQYVELVKPFQSHNRTWIKNGAKKYIKKFK